ncbi:hypothetical protein GGX14DRAFT_559495 [Mycena pura]|uniref:Uncharacterized protein n=1 Tax=Mycena pura TaxID=153505 RepID=A0AAD6VSS1_9AGAR|nr:hypothetical protein GGX14DRAFT_559495 [Mycena pura]
MPRKHKATKTTARPRKTTAKGIPLECSFCQDLIPKNLAQHERICRINSNTRREAENYRRRQPVEPLRSRETRVNRTDAGPSYAPMEDVQPPSPPATSLELPPMDLDPPPADEDVNLRLPQRFIYVKHHPHAKQPDEIIALDSAGLAESQSETTNPPQERPWAPFRCLADASFTYHSVSRRKSNKDIDEDLELLRNEWATESNVTFRNHRDMEKSVDAAREGNIRFNSTRISIDFDGRELGGTYDVDIRFRDPWEVMKRWIRDETLAPVSTWFSQERYLCTRGKIDFSNPLYEEPYTATTWGAVDDILPADEGYPACYLPAHIWLDKGLVSTKVKMHPILLRGCWIESATRNGSGNGGAALLGFVEMPAALRQVDVKALKGARRTEHDTLKRKIYHAVCEVILASLERRSRNGEALRFGDGVTRIGHPGILIESMDFEEIAAWLSLRNSRSNHPCPKCLVHHDDLHKLFKRSDRRTPEEMFRVLTQAATLNASQREELLKAYGLHNFVLLLWSFDHSDPYAAACYDLLHYFDGGKWGRHVWVLLKEYLQSEGLAARFNDNMNRFPRWRDLKHIMSPTTIDYSEGQTFVDILKSALPCLVQLLPRNSCLVRIVRSMQKVRVMLGLSVTTQTRLDHLNDLIREYELACNEVHEIFGKDFNFLKQHSLSHAIEDFMSKGTSRNMNTRVGEGFQQEVEKMYHKTNGKNAERQIGVQDEREEAMARVQMALNEWRQSQKDSDLGQDEQTLLPTSAGHWKLGSPTRRVSAHRLEAERASDPAFCNFNIRLREYIAQCHAAHQVRLEQKIEARSFDFPAYGATAQTFQIEQCKVIYVDYQSKVDWRSARDILRCNPHFHGAPRFDSVIYEDDGNPLALVEFHFIFRCHLPSGAVLDLALVQPFHETKWQPKTRTDCPIREISKTWKFIALEQVVRGALLCPIFGGKDGVHYIVDCIDEDMYLRLHDID